LGAALLRPIYFDETMRKLILTALIFLGGCATAEQKQIALSNGTTFDASELTRQVDFHRDPALYSIQILSEARVHQRLCSNLTAQEQALLGKLTEVIFRELDAKLEISTDHAKQTDFLRVTNYLEQHYSTEFQPKSCFDTKRSLSEFAATNLLS